MGVSNAVNTVVNTAAQKVTPHLIVLKVVHVLLMQGIYVVSAAGNERQNACLRSPGSASYRYVPVMNG